ncbi:hypothetical protein [Streptomyces sp. P9-A4]|uniref:hypothetical protein n=1 Tax=Streptomyces sp. P9-A4 TaxID=3072285 RepID=UPI002FC65B36
MAQNIRGPMNETGHTLAHPTGPAQQTVNVVAHATGPPEGDLLIDAGPDHYEWKDEDEYAHVRRLGIITDTEHQAVDTAREQVLGMLASRTGIFADADRWAAWRWNPAWPTPHLPGPTEASAGFSSRCG